MSLTREEVLGTKPPQEEVPWSKGGTVIVSAMNGIDREDFDKETSEMISDDDPAAHMKHYRERLLVRTMLNPDGSKMFGKEDVAALSAVWCAPLANAFEVAKRLNGFSPEAVEELEKNSESVPS